MFIKEKLHKLKSICYMGNFYYTFKIHTKIKTLFSVDKGILYDCLVLSQNTYTVVFKTVEYVKFVPNLYCQ